jgi:hypothetical protein
MVTAIMKSKEADTKRSQTVNKGSNGEVATPAWLVAKSAIAAGLKERAEKEQTTPSLIKPKQANDHSPYHAKLSRLLNS